MLVPGSSTDTHKGSTWTPIPVLRGINFALGAVEYFHPMAKFTVDAVLAAARKETGLHELGDEHFLEPLELMLDDYANDNQLSPLGRIISWSTLVHHVSNRMQIYHAFREHPEISEQRIVQPLYVIGLPRTGTTLLYELLAQNDAFRPLLFWESMNPAPQLNAQHGGIDPRIKKAEKTVKGLNRVAPDLKKIHDLDPHGPEECLGLLSNTFITPFFRGKLPGYREWLAKQPQEAVDRSYREYLDQLKLLHWQNSGRWLLKCPAHLFGLPSLMRVLPDARVIQTHRDPVECVPSLCSLSATMETIISQRVDPRQIGSQMMGRLKRMQNRSEQARAEQPSEKFFDLQYEQLVAEPIASVEQIYRAFDMEMTSEMRAKMETYLAKSKRKKHGSHRYSLAEFGLTEAEVRAAFTG